MVRFLCAITGGAALLFCGVAAALGDAGDEKDELAAIADAGNRSEEQRARNASRHPSETLAFFGIRDDMTVVEISPGLRRMVYGDSRAVLAREGPILRRGLRSGIRIGVLPQERESIQGEVDRGSIAL